MPTVIEVVQYDSDWPAKFAIEAKNIKHALGANCNIIHHIGSTAVPGLVAKPIIDMIPVVNDISKINDDQLIALGYTSRGEMGMPFRRFYNKGEPRAFHLHVWEVSNPEIDKHLLFKDFLISHSDYAAKYAGLKLKLAREYKHERKKYTESKELLIKQIIQKTGFNGLTIVQVNLPSELDAAKHFRQKYIFDKFPTSDPYIWTFDSSDHIHLALYQGIVIIGYAHIQLWHDKRAAIRIIVIDEPKRSHGYGGQFLALIEKWLKMQAYKSLHAESAPRALSFYKNHGYIAMPFEDPDGYESSVIDTPVGKIL